MEKEKKLQILSDIIEMETVGDNEKDICNYFKKLFDEYDIPSEVVELDEGENRANFVAELEGDGEGKTLVYSGHLDVVSAGDPDDWKHDPFKLTEENGMIFGRGVTDMKSGSAAIAIAMIELKESGESFNGKLLLILTSGEESEMPGSEKADERGDMKDADALVVAEPSNGAIISAHKGSFQYKITIKGKESHSSMPHLGINSIDIARKIMDGIDKSVEEYVADHEDNVLDKTFNVFTRLDGGDQVNSVPAKTILFGNARTTHAFDNDKFLEIINDVVEDVNKETKGEISVDVLENAIPVVRPEDSDLIKAIQKANKEQDYEEAWFKAAKEYVKDHDVDVDGVDIDEALASFDKNPNPILTADGVTDASFLLKSNDDADFALFGPGIAPVAHQVDEFMFLDDYYAYCEKYVLIAKAYLND